MPWDLQLLLLNGAFQVRYSKKVRDLEAADGEHRVGEAIIFSGVIQQSGKQLLLGGPASEVPIAVGTAGLNCKIEGQIECQIGCQIK